MFINRVAFINFKNTMDHHYRANNRHLRIRDNCPISHIYFRVNEQENEMSSWEFD